MNKWKPHDYIVAALTAAIVYVVIMIGIGPFFDLNLNSDARAKMVTGMLASVISIISVYIGANMNRKDDE